MFCSNCGKQINMQSKFCTGCGANLQGISNNQNILNNNQGALNNNQNVSNNNQNIKKNRKHMKKRKRSVFASLLIIILIIALLVTGALGYFHFKMKSETEQIPVSVTWHGEGDLSLYSSAETQYDSVDYSMEYAKNKKGQIEKVVLYDENGNYVDEIEYEYDSKGHCTCEYISALSFSNKGVDIYFKPTYKEWDGDLLIKNVYFEKNDYETFEYDNKGNIIKRTRYDNGDVLFVDENTLDDKGRVIKSRRKYGEKHDSIIETVRYEYDGNTDNTTLIDRGQGNRLEYEYEYDSKGRIITKETTSYSMGNFNYSIWETYEY